MSPVGMIRVFFADRRLRVKAAKAGPNVEPWSLVSWKDDRMRGSVLINLDVIYSA